MTSEAITKQSPDVSYASPTALNPSTFYINNSDPNAAAGSVLITVLQPVGYKLMIQIHSTKANRYGQYFYVIQNGDTPVSVAALMAAMINADTLMSAVGCGAQLIPTEPFMGISHTWDDVINIGCAAWDASGNQVQADEGGFAVVVQGSSQLDSGTCDVRQRNIPGRPLQAGDNISQYWGQAYTVQGNPTQFAGFAINVKNPNSQTVAGEFSIQTAAPAPGGTTTMQRFGICQGMYARGLADMGDGAIHATSLWVNGRQIA